MIHSLLSFAKDLALGGLQGYVDVGLPHAALLKLAGEYPAGVRGDGKVWISCFGVTLVVGELQ